MKTRTGRKAELSRRTFVVGSAAASGGLALGFNFFDAGRSARAQALGNDEAEINAWVVVKPDDTCVIRIARSEMGQGTRTGLAQLVAEELECDWKKVATESRLAKILLASAFGARWEPAAAAVSVRRRIMFAEAVRPRA